MGAAGSTPQGVPSEGHDGPSDMTLPAHSEVLPMLQEVCRRSHGAYALFWSISSDRLRVADAWAVDRNAKTFTSACGLVTFRPGEGAVGRVFRSNRHEFNSDVSTLAPTRFVRMRLARRHGVQSVVCMPWNGGVVEFGTTETWQEAPLSEVPSDGSCTPVTWQETPLSEVPSDGLLTSSSSSLSAPAWEAVSWKKSKYLGIWRQRKLRLTKAGAGWQLTSSLLDAEQVTGTWELSHDSCSTEFGSGHGFMTVLNLQDLQLAADTAAGCAELQELVAILGRCSAEASPCCSSGTMALSPACSPRSRSSSADFSCPSSASTCSPDDVVLLTSAASLSMPALPEQTTSSGRSALEKRNPLNSDAPASSSLSPPRPCCEACSGKPAAGKVVGSLVGGSEIAQWICRDCFVSSWTTIVADDGRWGERPRWLLLTQAGNLKDATPPDLRRYGRVASRSRRPHRNVVVGTACG
mmetsp:Transcript_129358/g.322490  ORF Transcript_129358/g.322490 Transcript_129358/m.322490 type:complete len:466 (+) Transcript_129358:55-1452(+)